MKHRGIILKVLLLLIAGATLNVAVAWGLAIGSLSWHHESGCARNYSDYDFVEMMTEGVSMCPTPLQALAQEYEWFDVDISAGIGVLEVIFDEAGGNEISHFACAGWPMLALHGVDRDLSGERLRPVWFGPAPTSINDRVIPTHPLWPGFAINTLFYAGVLWVLLCGPFALRRMIRRRRGQCPACAYPIGESPVCTECGGP